MKKVFIIFCLVIFLIATASAVNAADDDCELCPPRYCPEGKTRDCGTQFGICEGAAQKCIDGQWGACNITPVNEVCNGIDDDCNGIIDDMGGKLGAVDTACLCFDGHAPGIENCNGIDDNCNGIVDELGECCDAGSVKKCGISEDLDGIGICVAGTSVCGNDYLWSACEGVVYPRPETENGIDDDCNGEIDDVKNIIGENILMISVIAIVVLVAGIGAGVFILRKGDSPQTRAS